MTHNTKRSLQHAMLLPQIFLWIGCAQSSNVQPAKTSDQSMVVVDVEKVEWVADFESQVQVSGTIKPRRISDVSFERVGRVDTVSVSKGERVKAGQVLAELNIDVINAQVRKLQAELQASRAQLSELKAGPRTETIDSARYAVDEQQAQLEAAKQMLERRKRLQSTGAISVEDVEQAQWAVVRLESAKNASQKSLEELQLGTRSEKIATQEAIVASIQESIAAAKVEMNHSQIRSPFDGTIIERMVHEGNVANPGAVAFIVSETTDLEVHFGCSPEVAKQLTPGEYVDIEVRGSAFRTKLHSIVPSVDERTRTLDVIARIEPSDCSKVIPGDLAQLKITTKQDAGGFWISSTALIQGTRGLWDCFVAEANNSPTEESSEETSTVSKRPIEILQTQGDRVLVRGSLQNGEFVVSSLPNRLVVGQSVQTRLKTRP